MDHDPAAMEVRAGADRTTARGAYGNAIDPRWPRLSALGAPLWASLALYRVRVVPLPDLPANCCLKGRLRSEQLNPNDVVCLVSSSIEGWQAFMHPKHFWQVSLLDAERAEIGKHYLEFLRIPAMSAGLYVLPAGGTDSQSPHQEDEMYYVVRGKASVKVGAESQPVSAGSIILVEARVEHRFYDITEELVVLVFFAPAETT
jgi:quercetin dioxygenase-like cupin family protein